MEKQYLYSLNLITKSKTILMRQFILDETSLKSNNWNNKIVLNFTNKVKRLKAIMTILLKDL